jgi:hypothetical protein
VRSIIRSERGQSSSNTNCSSNIVNIRGIFTHIDIHREIKRSHTTLFPFCKSFKWKNKWLTVCNWPTCRFIDRQKLQLCARETQRTKRVTKSTESWSPIQSTSNVSKAFLGTSSRRWARDVPTPPNSDFDFSTGASSAFRNSVSHRSAAVLKFWFALHTIEASKSVNLYFLPISQLYVIETDVQMMKTTFLTMRTRN